MSQASAIWLWWLMAWAGIAAWFAIGPPPLARLAQSPSWWASRVAWLTPVADALPLRQRVLVGGAAGISITFFAWEMAPWNLIGGILAAPVVAIALGKLERGRHQRQRELLLAQAPGGLEAIAACLESGLPLRQATAVVSRLSSGALAAQLEIVVHGVGVGLSDAQAWRTLAGDPVLGPLARDVARAADWGTAVAQVINGHASDLRKTAEYEAKTKARAVGVRAVLPLSLCYLPAFILLGVVPALASGLKLTLGF